MARLRALDSSKPPLPLVLAELEEEAAGGLTGVFDGPLDSLASGYRVDRRFAGALAVHRGGRRWKVPGERLLKLVGDGPPTAEVAGWTAVALENESLARGQAWAHSSIRSPARPSRPGSGSMSLRLADSWCRRPRRWRRSRWWGGVKRGVGAPSKRLSIRWRAFRLADRDDCDRTTHRTRASGPRAGNGSRLTSRPGFQ